LIHFLILIIEVIYETRYEAEVCKRVLISQVETNSDNKMCTNTKLDLLWNIL